MSFARPIIFGVLALMTVNWSTHLNATPSQKLCDTIELGKVWSGTRVGFGGISTESMAIASYYDASRRLTVDRIDLHQCKVVENVHLDSVFAGWDSHDEIRVALDQDGGLHIAANMHDSELVYFYSSSFENLAGLKRARMLGQQEAHVTYPRFLPSRNSLIFIYRNGASGRGEWYANEFKQNVWSRTTAHPFFSSLDEKGSVSAYPSGVTLDKNDNFHISVVWRRTSDVSSNFRLSYVRTRDFRHFTDSSGNSYQIPIQPATAEIVTDPGINHGLVNNSQVSISPSGSPTIIFTQYGPDGKNGIFIAQHKNNSWSGHQIASAHRRSEIKGGGSLASVPRFTAIDFSGAEPLISVRFPGERPFRLRLEKDTLLANGTASEAKISSTSRVDLGNPDLIDRVETSATLNAAEPDSPRVELRWATQAPNQDKPRECTPANPGSCDPPPSTLWLLVHRGT